MSVGDLKENEAREGIFLGFRRMRGHRIRRVREKIGEEVSANLLIGEVFCPNYYSEKSLINKSKEGKAVTKTIGVNGLKDSNAINDTRDLKETEEIIIFLASFVSDGDIVVDIDFFNVYKKIEKNSIDKYKYLKTRI